MPRNVVASTYLTLDGYLDEPGTWSFPAAAASRSTT